MCDGGWNILAQTEKQCAQRMNHVGDKNSTLRFKSDSQMHPKK